MAVPSLRYIHRGPHHLVDTLCAGRQHHQAIEAERHAAGRRHGAQRGNEIVVDRIALAIDALLLRHFGGKPPTLFDRVGEFAKPVRELDPADPGPLRDLTRLYSALRDAKGALSAWGRLAELDPLNLEASVQVAQLAMATGDAPRALSVLESAVSSRPDNARVQALLGDLKAQTGRAAEAEKHYAAAARLDQNDLASRLKLGELLVAARRVPRHR